MSEFKLEHIQLLSDKMTVLMVDKNQDIYLYNINGIEVTEYKPISLPEFIIVTNKKFI